MPELRPDAAIYTGPLGDLSDRHPGTQHFAPFFEYEHLREGLMRETSKSCAFLAHEMISDLADGPELTAGLRSLLQAKDAFVRQAMLTEMNKVRT